ncbi:MAG: type II toxin-antitoxin system VapC family toxin [Ignavibacteriaceae bacterium]|nr:type II toxin-antitoxin system VapC family toxin [Ignavibacteriaceae bacterium]
MSGTSLLCDTNILLYLLSGDKTVTELLNLKKIFISFITEIELLTFKKLSIGEKKVIGELFSNCNIIGLNEEVKRKTIEIRINNKLKIPDSIIAATVGYLKIPLVSADKQFKQLEDINLIFYQV